ncbi:DUF707 domain-containing protein [Nitrosospira sp. NpAV]|uniref:DUF707 domain-containing protein n=1 Tax=Nitrosospira sp. NpAV TaxID=58133 RepID=UPI00059F33E7|nr:DUF707 domain-containing protein [Nitrosospira sp. NpAV]KIO49290.1 hypothetical protein SQ11_06200 [Nitrosospira sp. NpAV]
MSSNPGILIRYIDLPWYRKISGRRFSSGADAAAYYVREGEARGDWPNPLFDPGFYRQQIKLGADKSSLQHFVTDSAGRKSRPSRFFDLDWYEWQNPDFSETGCGLLHYLEIGGKQYRDPCPQVDMTALSRVHGHLGDGTILTHLLAAGHIDCRMVNAVTNDDTDLVRRQREFRRKIKPSLLKSRTQPLQGRNLVFVQCAKNTEFWSWFDAKKKRDWDIFLNCYAGDFPETRNAEHVCEQAGTKFTGMFNCWLHWPEIFNLYDNILFIDDDLVFNFKDISTFFKKMEDAMLDLAQPSLSAESQCIWQAFFNVQKTGSRKTNSVEIMMPALSRRARDIFLPYFLYSVSGFGLDLLMGKLASTHELTVGVIDDIIVHHGKNIDQSNGAYYEFLRRNHINSRYELWRIINIFQTSRGLYEMN